MRIEKKELLALVALLGVSVNGAVACGENGGDCCKKLDAIDRSSGKQLGGKEEACGAGACGADEKGAAAAKKKHDEAKKEAGGKKEGKKESGKSGSQKK